MANKRPKKKKTAGDIVLSLILVSAICVFCYEAFNLFHIYTEYKKGTDEYNNLVQMAVTEKEPDAEIKPAEEVLKPPMEAFNLFHIYTEYKKGTDEYNNLVQMAVTEKEPDAEIKPAEEVLKPPMDIDFNTLKSVNPEVIGWIYVEALEGVNYPVVQAADNDKYLHLTYEGNYNFAGTIFIDYENSSDFNDCNTLVYGHNMKNGSMFGQLKKFTENEEAFNKSRYFWIFVPGKAYRYEIISAYTTSVNSDTYTLFKGPGEEYLK